MTNKSVRDRQREESGRDREAGGKRLANKMVEIEGEEKKRGFGETVGGRGGM